MERLFRYDLYDNVQLMTKDGYRIKKLAEWIDDDPILLYEHMYLAGIEKNRYRKVSITSLAYSRFKKSLVQRCRKCFEDLIRKQKLKREYRR